MTLTFLDPEWSHDLRSRRLISEITLEEFTRETGIRIKHLPAPETAPEQLALPVNYTVEGKLVAMPYHTNIGILFYGTDLRTKMRVSSATPNLG